MAERYDTRTGLIVVDVQNDFADPAGGLSVAGGLAAIEHINTEISAAHGAGAFVVYTQDWHPESTPHFAKDGGTWPVHCVAGTWGAQLHPSLQVVDGAPVVQKGTGGEDGYSGFSVRDPETGEESSTALERHLRAAGVERVVVVGIATDVCVRATAEDALRLDLPATVVAAATAAVEADPGDGQRALDALAEAGATIA